MVWPPDELFRRDPYPYCQILETPDNSQYPYSIVISYADDRWDFEPMATLEEARLRAEEWTRIWLQPTGTVRERQGWSARR